MNLFIIHYQDSTPVALPNGVTVSSGARFLAVQGKGLVHLWSPDAITAIAPVVAGLGVPTVKLNNAEFFIFWQLFSINGTGLKPAI